MNLEGQNASAANAMQSVATINELHRTVEQCCARSEAELHSALVAAWKAGHLLCEQKRQVVRQMGHGVWERWLEKNFHGSVRTAQRYMQLAKSVTGVTELEGLSLRQACMRLGMRVEEKGTRPNTVVPALPGALRSVTRLLRIIPSPTEFRSLPSERQQLLRRDLRPVWERLSNIFSDGSQLRPDKAGDSKASRA